MLSLQALRRQFALGVADYYPESVEGGRCIAVRKTRNATMQGKQDMFAQHEAKQNDDVT